MGPMILTQECSRCEGEGKILTSKHGGNDPDAWYIECPDCDGEGVEEVDLNDEIDEED